MINTFFAKITKISEIPEFSNRLNFRSAQPPAFDNNAYETRTPD